jgi:hypothetical protein
VPVNLHFVSYGQITQTPTVIVGQFVNENNEGLSLEFNGELDNVHSDSYLVASCCLNQYR